MFFVAAFFWFSCFSIDAQSSERSEQAIRTMPQDISEYYLIIPGKPYYVYAVPDKGISEFEYRKSYLKPRKGVIIEIDKKNAFLSITDNSYELTFKVQLTYFVRADGKKIIAVNEDQAGGDCDWRELKFYQFEAGKFTDITNEVMPELKLKDFCGSAPAEKYSRFEPLYDLPRLGTTIKISAKMFCEQDNVTRVNYEEYVKYFRNLSCKKIEFQWDKASGKFNIKK